MTTITKKIKNQLNHQEKDPHVVNAAIRQTQQATTDIINNGLPQSIMTTRGDIIFQGASGPTRLGAGTAGQVLQTNGTSSDPTWVTRWSIASKAADEARASNTTLTNDSTLQFAVAANTNYRFRGVVFYDTPTAADFKWDINGPASPTLLQIQRKVMKPGDTSYGGIAIETAFGFGGPVVITEVSGTNGFFQFYGLLQNGANAGTVAVRWAQNTTNVSNTTVRAGSYLEYAPA